jgi:hypothetical protein
LQVVVEVILGVFEGQIYERPQLTVVRVSPVTTVGVLERQIVELQVVTRAQRRVHHVQTIWLYLRQCNPQCNPQPIAHRCTSTAAALRFQPQ